MYMYNNHFVVYLKLTQHYKSAILQKKKKNRTKTKQKKKKKVIHLCFLYLQSGKLRSRTI